MRALEFITVAALIEFMVLGGMVGWARGKFGIEAPATTGDPVFERYFRVHMNTLEALVVFLPALWIFAQRISYWLAFFLGIVFIAGRALYAWGYINDPDQRAIGARATEFVNVVLVLGSLLGIIF